MRNSTERTEGTRRLGGTQGQDIVKPLDTGKPQDNALKMITCYKCHKQGHMSRVHSGKGEYQGGETIASGSEGGIQEWEEFNKG